HPVNEAAHAKHVDVHLFRNTSYVIHCQIGARAAGIPLGASSQIDLLSFSHPARYAMLRRALLLGGVDMPPLHGWVSAVHEGEVLDATVRAFDRAFQRLRHVPGFRL